MQQRCGAVVVDDCDILQAIVIVIPKCCSAPDVAPLEIRPRPATDIHKTTMLRITEQLRRHLVRSLSVSCSIDVSICNEQVQPSIVVEINEICAPSH